MSKLAAILRQTGRNLQRTWPTQIMTLLTVSLSVLIFAFFFLVYLNMLKASERLDDELRLTVFLNEEVVPALRPQIEEKIRAFGRVDRIVFVSRKQAFQRLASQLGRDRDVLADLSPDFLPPSIEVYPHKDLKTLARLDLFSEYLLSLPGAAKVQYGRDWLQRFGHFTSLLRMIVLLSGSLLVLSMTFMIAYTIRLTVISRQEELEVLRLLGASSSYVRGPLLLEGLLQGLVGAGLGLVSLFLLYRWISERFSGPGFLRLFQFNFFPAEVTGAILATVIILCTAGSLVSIRKSLRV